MSEERTVGVDVPAVIPEAAAMFMAHHLALAAAYYEATDIDRDTLIEVIERSMCDLAANAAVIWLDHLDAAYEQLDKYPANEED